jgi:hypothetical protein
MRKLTLNLNALVVQSFVTDDVAARLFGTVHARQHKGHTGQQDTDCSAVDACPSRIGEDCQSHKPCSDLAPCVSNVECPSKNNPCSDFVACTEIDCPSGGYGQGQGCTKGHNCDMSRDNPCISERECTQVDCPAEA